MMRFKRKQRVRHVATGAVYRIIHTPSICRLEATNAPAYAYTLADEGLLLNKGVPGPLWVRAQAEMEDGRFEEVRHV